MNFNSATYKSELTKWNEKENDAKGDYHVKISCQEVLIKQPWGMTWEWDYPDVDLRSMLLNGEKKNN